MRSFEPSMLENPEQKEPAFEIRHAERENFETMYGIFERACLDSYPDVSMGISREDVEEEFDSETHQNNVYAEWERRLTEKKSTIFVAKDGDKIIGFSEAIRGLEANKIDALYVDPEYHGTGVAAKLIATDEAFFDNNKPTQLLVAAYNVRAKRFYEKSGFRVVAPGAKVNILKGKLVPTYLMEKPRSGS